jgi:hypothetical protein
MRLVLAGGLPGCCGKKAISVVWFEAGLALVFPLFRQATGSERTVA